MDIILNFQITFDKFLKENDANSVESIRRVEQETRRKLEKVAAVKKLHNTIRGIETEISKSEERLKMFKVSFSRALPMLFFGDFRNAFVSYHNDAAAGV